MTTDQILDEAIAYAAEAWPRFEAKLPANLHFRDKVTFLAQQVRPAMVVGSPR